jgi:Flp pilus assembly protein TadG
LRRRRTNLPPGSRRNNEQGIVILLVAVVMLFVVGAMAALSIDVVTLYTARSEAQLAADSAALAAARVLANSGATSDPTGATMANAWNLAQAVAIQVAVQNEVGGRNLTAAEVTLPPAPGGPNTNPTVTVRVQRTDLPTFFARIWGSKFVTVAASATAEAYNPSGADALDLDPPPKVAPTCVKPWLLPNIDPSNPPNPIFVTATGRIAPTATALLGWTYNTPTTGIPMSLFCTGGDCTGPPGPPKAWNYYPGDDATTFPHPTRSLPACTPALTSNYQESIAGCIQTPIACNSPANIDISPYGTVRNTETADAVNCLTHATANPLDADQVDLTATPSPPFQFLSGAKNPIPGAAGKDVMVSSSLVTVPVFDTASFAPPSNTVTIIGFVQLFLNPDGTPTPATGNVNATVINMAGCGTGATGQAILGNGASPVVVRLISP